MTSLRHSGSAAATVVIAVIASLIVGLLGGVGGAYVYLRMVSPPDAGGAAPPEVRPQPRPSVRVLTEQDAIVKAVAAVDPAVVKIVATTVVEPSNPFERFFGGTRVQRGMGSGVIFDYEGRKLVLTNTHVVGDAEEIVVKLKTGAELKGGLLGADRSSDVAVVALEGDAAGLPSAELGSSDGLNIGEWVVAIGHPYEFEHTVTVGVVSALGPRPVASGRAGKITRNVIQTDAAINQGNSGGPLINLAGQVVGINSMIFSPTGATVGIGFAIPISDAFEVVRFLIHGGPWIGIEQAITNSQGLSRYLRLTADRGVVVLRVARDGPAARSGLKQADVILSVDGRQIDNLDELRSAIFRRRIGDTIILGIQRGANRMQLSVKAGRIPQGYYR